MFRRLFPLLVLTLLLAWADGAAAQSRGTRARKQPKASEDVKLAPGMRLGRPLALTTDYMGRPLKPKNKLTSTPVKSGRGQATSMSARGTTASGGRAASSSKSTTKKKAARR